MKALKIYNDKLKDRQKKSTLIETLDAEDSILNESQPKVRVSVQKKKKISPLKPLWRDKNAAQIADDVLERFALQL